MIRIPHYETVQMLTWLLTSRNRRKPYFTVTVQSASASFNYSFTPYITAGQSFWVDWGDGSRETYTTAGSSEKTHKYSTSGTYTVRMRGSAGINRVRISPTYEDQAALVIDSNGNLDMLGTITDTTDMFRACPNLVMTELTGGITSIDNSAFVNCPNLALTSLPEGITSIGSYAFFGCTSLALTSLPEGVTSISDHAFTHTNLALTSLPAGVTSISTGTFANCTKLALTSLPEGVTSISDHAFNGCTNLALTSLPEDVTSIGERAFFACKGLTNLIFLGTPTSISIPAFYDSGVHLYVPWSSGAVADAPWGAASVTYDYTP